MASASTSQQFAPGQPLLRRPKNSGSLRGTYTQGRVTVHGDLLVVGQRHDNSFLFLETVPNAAMPTPIFTDISVNPGYTIAGLGLDVRVDRQLTFYARVNNVGDTAYDSVLGYPGMPRTVAAGARFTLGRP